MNYSFLYPDLKTSFHSIQSQIERANRVAQMPLYGADKTPNCAAAIPTSAQINDPNGTSHMNVASAVGEWLAKPPVS
jgi:hypothetical protein